MINALRAVIAVAVIIGILVFLPALLWHFHELIRSCMVH